MVKLDDKTILDTVKRLWDYNLRRQAKVPKMGFYPLAIHCQVIAVWALGRQHGHPDTLNCRTNTRIRNICNRLVKQGKLQVYYLQASVFFPNKYPGSSPQPGQRRKVKCFRPVNLLEAMAEAANGS